VSPVLLEERVPRAVLALCRKLRDGGHRVWIVGGSLRDLLLGRKPGDWDMATDARPERVRSLFRRVIDTGIAHGTVTVLWKGGRYEVTTLRGEGGYSDGRRPDSVVFINDLDRDLGRRDFTVNAIAYDPLEERLVDPHGGLEDIEKGILRAVGDPLHRFQEDGLRVLRAVRFAATLQFRLEEGTLRSIPDALDSYARVSRERVRDEWLKLMKAPEPSRGFELMRGTGILGVTCPQLLEQVGCTQNRCHAFDVWTHTMRCVDVAPAETVLRLAALFHDLGKPRSRAFSEKKSDYTFYDHERVGAEMADEWLLEYRFSNHERERIVHLIRHHLICYSEQWTDAALRRFLRRVGVDRVPELLALARADLMAKGMDVRSDMAGLEKLAERARAVLAQGSALSVGQLSIDGNDVMQRLDLEPGPKVGEILRKVLDRVLESPDLNRRETLLSLLDELGGTES
jgi:tRNA nucleotidyltransferase (CCA-adding enzyme)